MGALTVKIVNEHDVRIIDLENKVKELEKLPGILFKDYMTGKEEPSGPLGRWYNHWLKEK